MPIYLCLLSLPIFLLALALFVGGYLLQFAGHLLEGTDPGEIIYFKRKLGLPLRRVPQHARHALPRIEPRLPRMWMNRSGSRPVPLSLPSSRRCWLAEALEPAQAVRGPSRLGKSVDGGADRRRSRESFVPRFEPAQPDDRSMALRILARLGSGNR